MVQSQPYGRALMRLTTVGLFLFALLAPFGPAAPAAALAVNPAVVISQVYGGGGNSGAPFTNDYVELFNRSAAPVSLSGMSLQYASATGTGNFSSNPVVALNGDLAPGQYYLVQLTGGNTGVALPPADAAGTINASGTAGKFALVNSTSGLACNGGSTLCTTEQLALIIDLVGYGSANFFEGSAAPALTNSTAALRAASGCTDSNNNSTDFGTGTPAPRNTASLLNPCASPPADTAPSVTSVTPANGTVDVAVDANLTVTFSEAVDVASGAFALSCGGSPVTLTASGGPTTFTLDPATSLAEGASCTLTVVASLVTDQDTSDPPDSMDADFTSSFSTVSSVAPCEQSFTPIYDIQGSGASAAITGAVTTQGVVVGDYEGANEVGIGGFYIQDATGDGDPATSDGIFVFTGSADLVNAGDLVRVSGFARERFNETTINGTNTNSAAVPATSIVNCGTGSVAPTTVELPVPDSSYLERYEGMLIRLPQNLVISEYFNYDRFGEYVLALPIGSEGRPYTPTTLEVPGSPEYFARLDLNLRSRILIDDGLGTQNPEVGNTHPNGQPFSLSNSFRGGDIVSGFTGVLGFGFNNYRVQPTSYGNYTAVNPRPATPEEVGGSLRVAAFNALNYFLTLDYPSSSSLDNACGPQQTLECRGADSDQPAEFERQRAKLLATLLGLNADVVGLIEIENTTGVEPLADIVAGLNQSLGAGTYAYIETGTIGTDAIKVGLIYQPAKVTPIGNYAILDSSVDPRFDTNRNRPALAQTFEEAATGGRFTVVVNHLKSKGSGCGAGDDDLSTGQGNCNGTRTAAAQALADWLAGDPTGSGDPDFMIIGDLNAYAKEEPITALENAGYSNLIAQFQGPLAYSYGFDGQFGYLDHALANASLSAQVTGVTEWHSNADEPDLIDYDTSFKSPTQDGYYAPDAFRASDHDPVLVGLNLTPTSATLTIVKLANPAAPWLDWTFTGSGGIGDFTLDNDPASDTPDRVSFELAPGSYTLSETNKPANWDLTSLSCPNAASIAEGTTVTVELAPGAEVTCTFVNERRPQIQITKYNDLNGNGSRDSDEPGLSGWQLFLYRADGSGGWTQIQPREVRTNANGIANYTSLQPGVDHLVCEEDRPGWQNTGPADAFAYDGKLCQVVSGLSYGEVRPVSFGNMLVIYRARQLGARVLIERNADLADLSDWVPPGLAPWALVARTNGAGDNGQLRGFFVEGGVPYAIVFNRSNNKGDRCILLTPRSLAKVNKGQTRLMNNVNDNYLPCPPTSYAQLP
jgi:uncharacterized protein